MATLRISTQDAPHARSPWSPVLSPMTSSSSQEDLASRCRRLAFKLGHDAVNDDPAFAHEAPPTPTSPSGSPSRLLPSPRSASSAFSPQLLSPLSPRSTPLHPPPTPEGSFLLSEILEEENEDNTPKVEVTSPFDLPPAPTGGSAPKSLGPGEGAYGTSAVADDELSVSSGAPGGLGPVSGRKSSFTGGVRESIQQEVDAQELAEATIEEEVTAIRMALKEGATWMAADIWLVDGELLVAPNHESLDPARTFSACFVEPLLRVFSGSAVPVGIAHRRRSSVFAHIHPHHPFQLVVRLHTPASLTFPFLVDALQPLNDASLLTSYCPNACVTTPALITVVSSSAHGAEMIPVEDLKAVAGPRVVYRDADIATFETDDGAAQWSREVTPVAAGNLREATGWDGSSPLSEEQRERIEKQVAGAHRREIKVRYEGLPQFPVHVRESVKSTLHGLGVDYL
ncbi:hypothetical protein JCM8097_001075 [Rhodosporidiobolus ruineniae]